MNKVVIYIAKILAFRIRPSSKFPIHDTKWPLSSINPCWLWFDTLRAACLIPSAASPYARTLESALSLEP